MYISKKDLKVYYIISVSKRFSNPLLVARRNRKGYNFTVNAIETRNRRMWKICATSRN